MHVAQVEHGLSAVLLLGRNSIVRGSRFVIQLSALPVEVIIANFYSRICISCKLHDPCMYMRLTCIITHKMYNNWL